MKPGEAVKEVAARILCLAGVPALTRRRLRGRLAILMYHGVEAELPVPRCPYITDTATLRRELEYLRRHFNVLPLEEALERLCDGTLPDRAAALTFDDGTRNLATHAAPILRELGLPAAVFLTTGPMGSGEALWADWLWIAFAQTDLPEIDLAGIGLGRYPLRSDAERGTAWEAATTRVKGLPDEERIAWVEQLVGELGPEVDAYGTPFQMLSWDEARALISDGLVSLHPHSVTHPIFSRCNDQKVVYEISESCATLARETGQTPSIFAYPNGNLDDIDARVRASLRRNGIRWALAVSRGFAYPYSDPYAVPRIGIGSNTSYARFRVIVSGARPRLRPRSASQNDGWRAQFSGRHPSADQPANVTAHRRRE
jgi:peptidoglycan/xylan/chitin deacetylase (PgdA/CDA1 family)